MKKQKLTEISNEKTKINHMSNIMLKHHNIFPTKTSFFISCAGKI